MWHSTVVYTSTLAMKYDMLQTQTFLWRNTLYGNDLEGNKQEGLIRSTNIKQATGWRATRKKIDATGYQKGPPACRTYCCCNSNTRRLVCYRRAPCRGLIIVWGSNLRLSGITHNARYPSAPLGLARGLLVGKIPVSTLLLHRLCTTSQRQHTLRLSSSHT